MDNYGRHKLDTKGFKFQKVFDVMAAAIFATVIILGFAFLLRLLFF